MPGISAVSALSCGCLPPAKIENISGKRLSASTIKIAQIPGTRYTLHANSEYNLDRHKFGDVDRNWSPAEFKKMLDECRQAQQEDYWAYLIVARNVGLRLHEGMLIDTAIARASLKVGFLTIKVKGGKVR